MRRTYKRRRIHRKQNDESSTLLTTSPTSRNDQILQLQRTIGNRATQEVLNSLDSDKSKSPTKTDGVLQRAFGVSKKKRKKKTGSYYKNYLESIKQLDTVENKMLPALNKAGKRGDANEFLLILQQTASIGSAAQSIFANPGIINEANISQSIKDMFPDFGYVMQKLFTYRTKLAKKLNSIINQYAQHEEFLVALDYYQYGMEKADRRTSHLTGYLYQLGDASEIYRKDEEEGAEQTSDYHLDQLHSIFGITPPSPMEDFSAYVPSAESALNRAEEAEQERLADLADGDIKDDDADYDGEKVNWRKVKASKGSIEKEIIERLKTVEGKMLPALKKAGRQGDVEGFIRTLEQIIEIGPGTLLAFGKPGILNTIDVPYDVIDNLPSPMWTSLLAILPYGEKVAVKMSAVVNQYLSDENFADALDFFYEKRANSEMYHGALAVFFTDIQEYWGLAQKHDEGFEEEDKTVRSLDDMYSTFRGMQRPPRLTDFNE